MNQKLYLFFAAFLVYVQTQGQDCPLNCTSMNVALNETCQRILLPQNMLLNPDPTCLPRLKVVVTDRNGRNYGNLVSSQSAGCDLTYRVVDTTTGNYCCASLTVRDNMPPTNELRDTIINCTDPLPDLVRMRDSCGAPVRVVVLSSQTVDFPCGSTYIKDNNAVTALA